MTTIPQSREKGKRTVTVTVTRTVNVADLRVGDVVDGSSLDSELLEGTTLTVEEIIPTRFFVRFSAEGYNDSIPKVFTDTAQLILSQAQTEEEED